MSKYTRHAVLGLSIAAVSIGMARPAGAKYYRSYLAGVMNRKICLGVKGGDLTKDKPIVTWECLGHPDQNWVSVPYLGTGYFQLSPGSPQPPSQNAMCVALKNDGKVDPNAFIPGWGIIWNCNAKTLDQAWELVPVGQDFQGHSCVVIRNAKAAALGYDMVLTVDADVYSQPHVAKPVYLYHNHWSGSQIWCEYDS